MKCCSFYVLLSLLLALEGCGRSKLAVKEIGEPGYPAAAIADHIQGTVQVGVSIGVNGRVLWATGTGADPILVEAAKKNAREWVFGPFPSETEFPIYHEIAYVYRFEGKPVTVVLRPPTIKTHLPDRLEIIATPFESDSRIKINPMNSPRKDNR